MTGQLGVREVLMVLYALVWAILLVAWSLRTGQWPPPEMFATLGVGEGALMMMFAAQASRSEPPPPAPAPRTEDTTR